MKAVFFSSAHLVKVAFDFSALGINKNKVGINNPGEKSP
jgi:hypothetical protein